jgi:guanylate kinase
MNNPLYMFIGKSASGKTTVADLLEKNCDLIQLQSYTTRPKRHENEIGHVFLTNEEFDELENIVAFTEYNGNRYGATAEQVDSVSIYVIDVDGVETLLENYQTERPIVAIYFDASLRTSIDRMINRGDSDMAIVSRLYNDEEFDWQKKLSKIIWHYKNNIGRDVEMYVVDANKNIVNVIEQAVSYMDIHLEGAQ